MYWKQLRSVSYTHLDVYKRQDYVGAFGNVDWGSTFAAIAISILPPLIIYFALNKWVTAGMTMGATKG